MRKLTIIPAVMVVMAFGSVSTFASSQHDDEMGVVTSEITLAQAIATAEKYSDGVASRAKFELSESIAMYDIQVVKDQKIQDVKVDADSGAIISSKADEED